MPIGLPRRVGILGGLLSIFLVEVALHAPARS
jgi:hypothetical protein